MCQRADQDVPEGYYPLFYQVLLDALSRPDEVVVQAILRNSVRLFSLSLPGVNILIPAFIACIRKEVCGSLISRMDSAMSSFVPISYLRLQLPTPCATRLMMFDPVAC